MTQLLMPVSVVCSALILAACSDACPELESCDIREKSCQEDIADIAACMRGGDSVQPKVRVVNYDTYVAAEVADAKKNQDTADDRAWRKSLSLLGLMDEDATAESVTRESDARIAAFYSSTDHSVTVLDRGEGLDSPWHAGLLLHEMVHALQDAENVERNIGGSDRDAWMASRAITEGEAVLYQDIAYAEAYGWDRDEISWRSVFEHYKRVGWQYGLEATNRYTMAYSAFSYAYGGDYVNRAWERDGFAAVHAIFKSAPASTNQVLAGYDSVVKDGPLKRDMPLDLGVPVLPEGYRLIGYESLGGWFVQVFDSDYLTEPSAPLGGVIHRAFMGDLLTVFGMANSDDVVVTWRLRMTDEDAAKAAARFYQTRTRIHVTQLGKDVVLIASSLKELPPELDAPLDWKPVPAPADDSDAMNNAALRERGPSNIECPRRTTDR